MIDPADLYNFIFMSASLFLIIEAIFNVISEIKKPSSTSLTQATMWIRSLLMIVLGVVIFMFVRSSQTTTVGGGGAGAPLLA
jgi:hypothetical protein